MTLENRQSTLPGKQDREPARQPLVLRCGKYSVANALEVLGHTLPHNNKLDMDNKEMQRVKVNIWLHTQAAKGYVNLTMVKYFQLLAHKMLTICILPVHPVICVLQLFCF